MFGTYVLPKEDPAPFFFLQSTKQTQAPRPRTPPSSIKMHHPQASDGNPSEAAYPIHPSISIGSKPETIHHSSSDKAGSCHASQKGKKDSSKSSTKNKELMEADFRVVV